MNTLPQSAFWQGKRVLLTGHTGFKGSWLSLWLLELGSIVTGFSLPPETDPSLFTQLGLESRLDHRLGDIRDAALVAELVQEVQPEVSQPKCTTSSNKNKKKQKRK